MNKTLLAYLRKFDIYEDSVFEILTTELSEEHKHCAICAKLGSKFTATTERDAIMLLKAQIVKEHSSFAIIEPYNGAEKLLSIYDCGRLVLRVGNVRFKR